MVKERARMQILEFQNMMKQIYFHRHAKRGTAGTYEWLVDEVQEPGDALKEDDKKGLEDEFADVLAWLASLANVVNISLEEAALRKYGGRCPRYFQNPCNCQP